jgi:hypothetical protein
MRLADERSQLVNGSDSAGNPMVAGIFHLMLRLRSPRIDQALAFNAGRKQREWTLTLPSPAHNAGVDKYKNRFA